MFFSVRVEGRDDVNIESCVPLSCRVEQVVGEVIGGAVGDVGGDGVGVVNPGNVIFLLIRVQ